MKLPCYKRSTLSICLAWSVLLPLLWNFRVHNNASNKAPFSGGRRVFLESFDGVCGAFRKTLHYILSQTWDCIFDTLVQLQNSIPVYINLTCLVHDFILIKWLPKWTKCTRILKSEDRKHSNAMPLAWRRTCVYFFFDSVPSPSPYSRMNVLSTKHFSNLEY